ncbi:MAG TPA: hypothetical protein VFS39_00450 [Nitrospira sp.]|nr:hypothetical protein [Nitrospira sp.]
MGKRSDFRRRPHDAYATPFEPVVALIPHLRGVRTFAEPCAGAGDLIAHLETFGLSCVWEGDIQAGVDALTKPHFGPCDAIITNPPWTREIMHPMILHFQSIAPTWLLFDADWVHTKQAAPFLDQCSHIVSVGRVKWIEGSAHTGKDNAAWHRFHAQHSGGPRFFGQVLKEAAA